MKSSVILYLAALSAVIFVSCGKTNDGSTLILGGSDIYSVASGEHVINLFDKKMVNIYDSLINNIPNLLIPLHKVVKSDEYTMFIGIPLNVERDSLPYLILNSISGDAIASDMRNKKSYGIFARKSVDFIYLEIIANEDGSSKYVFSIVGKDSLKLFKMYNSGYVPKSFKFGD